MLFRIILNGKSSRILTLLLISALFTGLLTFISYGEEADYSGRILAAQTEEDGWHKTLDRHRLFSAAYGNHIYAAVGGDGVIKTSSDGKNWSVSHSTGLTLRSVIYGKGKFVAVGNLGQILTSTDGIKWDSSASGTEKNLTGIAFNGTTFVAVGDRGTLLISEDGTHWNRQNLDKEYSLSEIISGDGTFIATHSDTFNTIFISEDGREWRTVEPAADLYGYSVPAYNGETFLMIAKIPHQGGSVMVASKDGKAWTKVDNAPAIKAIASGGGGFAALGNASMDANNTLTQSIYTSADGRNWTVNSVKLEGGSYSELTLIQYMNNKWIGFSLPGEIYSSEDGLNWTRENTGLDGVYQNIAWDGSQFVAYDDTGNMAVSKDGNVWSKSAVRLNLGRPVRSISFLDKNVIAVVAGDPAQLYISKDGANWTLQRIEGLNGLEYGRVISIGDRYVLNAGDAIYTSDDAERWEKSATTYTSLRTQGIAYNGKTYVSVGGRDIIVGGEGNRSEPYRIIGTSSDMKEWKIERVDNTDALNSIIFAKGQFVTVGNNGTILVSKDGLSGWTKAASPTDSDLTNINYDGARYIASGENGTIIHSTDGIHWIKEKSITSDSITKVIPAGNYYLALGTGTILKGRIAAGTERISFEDIENHWAKNAIIQIAERKIIFGIDGKTFAPDRDITRAEFAAIIVRALDLKYSGSDLKLSDIKASDWYYETISAAYENGIMNGYGKGMIKPGQNITREEAMAMMARALKLRNIDTGISETEISEAVKSFKDKSSISAWAAETAAVCVRSGLFEGNNGYLKPRDNITRAETATIVLRMLDMNE